MNFPEHKTVLLINHHLQDYGGSELVTLDLALDFQNRGWNVSIATFSIGGHIRKLCEQNNFAVFNVLNNALPIKQFDLIWGHHFPVFTKCLVEDGVKTKHLVLSSLSPYEPLEAIPFFYSQADLILCNSEETKKEIIEDNSYLNLDKNKIFVFKNSVPANWFNSRLNRDNIVLTNIAIISNHPPAEVLAAMDILKSQGIHTNLIGISGTTQLVDINLLGSYDAVITIGRTVQHSMSLGIPVFCYDHFGDHGWLTPDNFLLAEWFNYSGRCCYKRFSSTELVDELINGFVESKKHINLFRNYAFENYSLTKNVEYVLTRINHASEENKDYISFNSQQVIGKVGKAYRRILSEREILHQEVERLQCQLQSQAVELGGWHSQLQQTEVKLEEKINQLQIDLLREQNNIAEMQSSKFWKLRIFYFKLSLKLKSICRRYMLRI